MAGIAAPLQPTLAVHSRSCSSLSICSCLVITHAHDQAIEIDRARARLSAAVLHPQVMANLLKMLSLLPSSRAHLLMDIQR